MEEGTERDMGGGKIRSSLQVTYNQSKMENVTKIIFQRHIYLYEKFPYNTFLSL